MASVYPGTLDSFTTKQNKQDVYDAADINDVQNAIVATQTELGVDVAGDKADLVTRLDQCIASNGAMRSGTSNPVSPTPQDGDFFYRTDENVMYIYNGASWDSQGQSLSNVLFSFGFHGEDFTADSIGIMMDDDLNAAETGITALYWAVKSTSAQTVISSKLTKIAGVSTVTFYAYAWDGGVGEEIDVIVDIGGQTGTVATTSATPTWLNQTVDISSLSDGTVYDLKIQLLSDNSGVEAHLGSIIGFGS